MPSSRPLVTRFRALRPALGLALGIGAAAVLLNVAVARQLVRFGTEAQALAEGWIAHSAALATFQSTARDFRQAEARYALATDAAARVGPQAVLDSTAAVLDRTLVALAGFAADSIAARRTTALAAAWRQYAARHDEADALATGEGSPALAAFRAREPEYGAMLERATALQTALRSDAGQRARRNRGATRTSAVLLSASVLLTLGALALAESVRRNARARATAERRWRELTEQRIGIVWEVDARGRVRFVSAAGLDFIGASDAAVHGRRALALVHPEDRARLVRAARDAAATRSPLRDLEVRVVRPDGTVGWLALSGQPLAALDDDAGGFRGLAVDITRRTQAEAALAQGRRLEALGTLAGGVAHDLNNVFAAITGYAQLAKVQGRGAGVDEDLDAIEHASDRGATLVRRILQFARRQPTQRAPIDLGAVVAEVVTLLRPQLPAGVTVEVHDAGRPATVLADPAELHQVVVNVCGNALQAMRARGGTLRIALGVRAEQVELVVQDDGEGMAPAVLERALEPFYTTRGVGEGTGMGLAVVHGVVHALGGTLHLASREQVGTTVRIVLPHHVADGASVEGGVRGASTPSAEHRAPTSARVMVVDDDALVARTTTRGLARLGYRVETYAAPMDALAALRTDPTRADLLLTDLTMPGMTGLELIAAARAAGVRMPVLLCSGFLDEATARDARALGVVTLLDKPVAIDALAAAVEDALSATVAGDG